MLYFTILLISSVLAVISAYNDCDLGEDYWCQSLSNANTCNAVKECLDVWRKSPGNEIQAALCMNCRRIVSELIVLNKDTEAIQGVCDTFKHKTERVACLEEIRRWTPDDIQEMIADLTCAKLDYCKLHLHDGMVKEILQVKQNELKLVPRGRSRRKRFLESLFHNAGNFYFNCCALGMGTIDLEADIPIANSSLKA